MTHRVDRFTRTYSLATFTPLLLCAAVSAACSMNSAQSAKRRAPEPATAGATGEHATTEDAGAAGAPEAGGGAAGAPETGGAAGEGQAGGAPGGGGSGGITDNADLVPGTTEVTHPRYAKLVLYNGRVFTGADEETDRWAEGVAISNGKVVAVGTTDDVLAYSGGNAPRINLQGRLLIPGINDAHVHALPMNPLGPMIIPPDYIPGPGPTLDEVLALVESAVHAYPAGTWLFGLVGNAFMEDPGANRFTLDERAPNYPVVLQNWAGHNMYINTAAMTAMGLDENQPDPFGGFYGRDPETGVLTGVLHEYAEFDFTRRMTMTLSSAEILQQFRGSFDGFRRRGVTSIQNMSWIPWDTLETLFDGTELPLRIRMICFPVSVEEAQTECQPGPSLTNTNNKYMSTGIKWILDGTPIERLAALNEPYSDAPAEMGRLAFPEDRYDEIFEAAVNSGSVRTSQRLFHAVGDHAITRLIEAMSNTGSDGKWSPRRLRIEHGNMIQPEQIPDLASKGVVVVISPTHFALGDLFRARLGDERAATMQPVRALLDSAVPIAFATDATGYTANPFLDMMLAVINPMHPENALTIEEALTAYTRGSAWAEYMDDEKGALSEGMFADLAVLSQDIFEVSPFSLPATESVLTVVDGQIVWDPGVLTVEEQ